MLFTRDHINKIASKQKWKTRRVVKPGEKFGTCYGALCVLSASGRTKWCVGSVYAIQPGRGKPAMGHIRLISIRRERLQDITPEDVWAEGVRCDVEYDPLDIGFDPDAWRLETYRRIWNGLNKRPGSRWDDNPDVWVLEFGYIEESMR